MSNTEFEQLPVLDSAYAVSEQDATEYRDNGHVLLRGVASVEEIAPYRDAIAARVQAASRSLKPLAERDTYHQAFVQVGNVWEDDPIVACFTMAQRFAQIAADLMGVDGVRLYHDQALFKEAGGGATPWHQDQYYWPLDNPNCVTMWMPLVDVPPEMGVLTFATGSHREGSLVSLAISDESEAQFDALVRERRFPIAAAGMKAGDATFHTGWTLHHAPGNRTDRCREIMTVIYIADGTRIIEPDNPHRPADLERWFPGQAPGEVAASRLNPVLYSRVS